MSDVVTSARELHPQEPWLWREDWAAGRIRSAAGPATVIAWIFALCFTAFSVPLLVVAGREIGESVGKAFFASIFPLAALGMWYWALVATARWKRFRGVELELGTRPGVLGGRLAGAVHLGASVNAEKPYRLILSCVRIRRSRKRNDEDVLWEEERLVPALEARRGFAGVAVPFAFDVPHELPASMVESVDQQQIVWRLQIHADLSGADLASVFEVPVYETARSSERVTERLSRDNPGDRVTVPLELATEEAVRVRRLADGVLELYFPAGRNKAGAAFLTVFAALWAWLVVYVTGEIPGLAKLFMLPFAAVGLLLWLFVPAAWLQRTTVHAQPGFLEISTRTFGHGRPKVLTAAAIEAIAAETTGSSNGRARWAIRVHPKTGKATSAGDELRSKSNAQKLAAALWCEVMGTA